MRTIPSKPLEQHLGVAVKTKMAGDSFDALMKVVVIGDSSVGKTCLVLRYTQDIFRENFLSTIGALKVGVAERSLIRVIVYLFMCAVGYMALNATTAAILHYRGFSVLEIASVFFDKRYCYKHLWLSACSKSCDACNSPSCANLCAPCTT